MRAVIQRVSSARVVVDGKSVGEIGRGIVILMAVKTGDSKREIEWMAEKCTNLRIFENDEGKFNLSIKQVGGSILVVSQFTLYGDCRRGRRPSFTESAPNQEAERIYDLFVDELKKSGLEVETGMFGRRMSVEIRNEGPVTFILDSEKRI